MTRCTNAGKRQGRTSQCQAMHVHWTSGRNEPQDRPDTHLEIWRIAGINANSWRACAKLPIKGDEVEEKGEAGELLKKNSPREIG